MIVYVHHRGHVLQSVMAAQTQAEVRGEKVDSIWMEGDSLAIEVVHDPDSPRWETFAPSQMADEALDIAGMIASGASQAEIHRRMERLMSKLGKMCYCDFGWSCCSPHNKHSAPHRNCVMR